MSEENRNTEPQQEEHPEHTELTELGEPVAEEVEPPAPEEEYRKQPRKISLTACVCITIALVLVAVLTTFAICFRVYRGKLAEIGTTEQPDPELAEDLGRYYPFALMDYLIDQHSIQTGDPQERIDEALKAYVYATGDRYAMYYTEEELELLNASAQGASEGIGINIIQDVTVVNGVEYKVLRVVNVMEGAPALSADLRIGDMIYAVGVGESAETISALGYDVALTKLRGTAGTQAEFTVIRPVGDDVELVDFQITRAAVTTTSVKGEAVISGEKKIGVVKIFSFDLTTPTQFKATMNRLIGEGCESFVYDVRSNPGGHQIAVEAVLSYFLNEGDVILSTKGKSGEESFKARVVEYPSQYASCNVSKEEIGMYRDYPCTVLCDENSASAAELFVANFRDYELGQIVGTKTYGKGILQSTFELIGYPGALRLTTALYYPPSGQNYHEEGITPDHVVEPSEELKKLNLYEINAEKDNQLAAALALLQ